MAASLKGEKSKTKVQNSISIESLMSTLTSGDRLARQNARKSLVAHGRSAVGPLVKALSHRNELVRREAAKALSELREPSTALALVRSLEDDRFEVRWLAAEGLIGLRRDGLIPLLQTLVRRSDSGRLREGAHHVLRFLARGKLKEALSPVLLSFA